MNDTPTATKLLADLAEAYRNALGLDGAHDAALKAAERFLEPFPSLKDRERALKQAVDCAHHNTAVSIQQLEQHESVLAEVMGRPGMHECKGTYAVAGRLRASIANTHRIAKAQWADWHK